MDGLQNGSSSHRIAIALENSSISAAIQARIALFSNPDLRSLVQEPCEEPLRSIVCVVGFQNVGKTALCEAWRRRDPDFVDDVTPPMKHAPAGDPASDDRTDKTAGVTILPITVQGEPITAVDFAGHAEYYLSHGMLLQCFAEAVFVVLFRLDCVNQEDEMTRLASQEDEAKRLLYWLKYIATMRRGGGGGGKPKVFMVGTFIKQSS